MLDMFGILVSTVAIIFIAIRASVFDHTLPWFEGDADRFDADLTDKG